MIKNVLITGSDGFLGKHICLKLENSGFNVFKFDKNNNETELTNFILKADAVIHLAGVNRPLNVDEFYDGNTNFTKKIVDLIKENKKSPLFIFASSIQAKLDNDYGKSKKMAEDYLFGSNLPVCIFRLNNVFGKWCRPNYNSVVATFCYNIAHDLPIEIRDKNYIITFNYIDDIVQGFIDCMVNNKNSSSIMEIQPTYQCSLGNLADLIYYFKKSIEGQEHLPIINSEFELKLFKTFCNYFSETQELNYAKDDRGSFEELFKSSKYGQISENISLPQITKGNHYHTYKNEIFYVVKGKCKISQRNVNADEIEEILVSEIDKKLVKIKPMFTHSIQNVGIENSYTLMWIDEVYNENTADTFKEMVEKEQL